MDKVKHSRLIILGSGPAGYTAAVYAARANLNPVLITGMAQGGQLMTTTDVDNWPADAMGVQGPDLMERFRKHAERFDRQEPGPPRPAALLDSLLGMLLEGAHELVHHPHTPASLRITVCTASRVDATVPRLPEGSTDDGVCGETLARKRLVRSYPKNLSAPH